jgi:endonuclease YncB( thermonuclease family)
MKHLAVLVLLTCFSTSAIPYGNWDGDTFEADVRVWYGFQNRIILFPERIRVEGVNTPERKKKTMVEALKAKVFVEEWLKRGDVTLTTCSGRDFNGRILAIVTRGNEGLASALIEAGLGVPDVR